MLQCNIFMARHLPLIHPLQTSIRQSCLSFSKHNNNHFPGTVSCWQLQKLSVAYLSWVKKWKIQSSSYRLVAGFCTWKLQTTQLCTLSSHIFQIQWPGRSSRSLTVICAIPVSSVILGNSWVGGREVVASLSELEANLPFLKGQTMAPL